MGSESVMTSCVDSYSDIFSHIDYGEGLVEEFSSAGIVPYISESKIKCVVLVLAVVFLVTGGFFIAFKAKVVGFWGLQAAGRA